jgi:hypothetical protein
MEMTTEVIVKANHGWPVKVTQLWVNGDFVAAAITVKPGEEGRFCVHSSQDLHVHEVQPGEAEPPEDYFVKLFKWEHLPEHLQAVSRPFAMTAQRLITQLPANAERVICLRKLLEAKDAAVRAVVVGLTPPLSQKV